MAESDDSTEFGRSGSGHADPDLLALLALGEPAGTADEHHHLDSCPLCAEDLAALSRVAVLGRSADPDAPLDVPGPEVWARLRTELALDPDLVPIPVAGLFLPGDDLRPPTAERHDEPGRTARGVELAHGLAAAGRGLAHRLRSLRPRLAAHAELATVGSHGQHRTGEARLEVDARGERSMRISVQAELPPTGVRYVWLLDRSDPTRMQPIGQLDTTKGFWSIGAAVDVDSYDLVDVSQQAVGSVLHSGESIFRGALVPA